MLVSNWFRRRKGDLEFAFSWMLVVLGLWLVLGVVAPALIDWLSRLNNWLILAMVGAIAFVVFFAGRRMYCRWLGEPQPAPDIPVSAREWRGI